MQNEMAQQPGVWVHPARRAGGHPRTSWARFNRL